MILLNVITPKNVWFAIIGILIMGSNLKKLFVMVAMTWKCCLNFSDIAIITAKGITYRCIIDGIIKYKAICLFENSVLDDRGYV